MMYGRSWRCLCYSGATISAKSNVCSWSPIYPRPSAEAAKRGAIHTYIYIYITYYIYIYAHLRTLIQPAVIVRDVLPLERVRERLASIEVRTRRASCSFCVSICTFVLVRQYLYFCTGRARKLSMPAAACR